MKANPQQTKAINHNDGPCVVTAVPGAGKTSVLTQRAIRLYKEGNKKILCLTFTNKAAEEMKVRIAKALEVEAAPFAVCTLHALCGDILRKFGKVLGYTPGLTILDSDDQKTFVKKIVRSVVDNKKLEKDIDINKIVYHLNTAREIYESYEEIAERFESNFDDDVYWEIAKTYLEDLVKNNCIDFSGMLYTTIKILEENPSILKVIQSKWDYVQVDECQDTNYAQFKFVDLISNHHNNVFLVGDISQCVTGNTIVETPSGPKEIRKIKEGELVKSACGNSKAEFKKVSKVYKIKNNNKYLIKITTKSGKSLTCTPEHICFADFKLKNKDMFFVYLMYREDLGYRVGTTKSYSNNSNHGRMGFATRSLGETADKVWVIESYESEKEARFWEQYFSVTYGLPTWTFNQHVKAKNSYDKKDIEKLFNMLDTNYSAEKIMYDYGLDFEYPHYSPKCMSNSRRRNFSVILCGDNRAKPLHCFAISGSSDGDKKTLAKAGIATRKAKKAKGWRVEGSRSNLNDIKEIYNSVHSAIDVNLIEKARFTNKSLSFLPARSLKRGMTTFICNDNEVIEDEIVSIEKVKNNNAFVYDIDVERTHNFSGNGILTHNSIYLFRGARYQNITDFIDKHENCVSIPLGQNYRSTPEIIKVANTLIKHNTSHIGVDFYTDNPSGVAPQVLPNVNPQEEAKHIATMIANDINVRGYKPHEISVLYRMNSLSIDLQLALSNYGINFAVIGGGNYFQLKEIKDGIAMLKFLLNPNDSLAFHRCADLVAGVGPNTIGKLENLAKEKGITIMDAAKMITSGQGTTDKRAKAFAAKVLEMWDDNFTNESPDTILVEMLNRFGYDKYLSKNFQKNYNKKKDNLQALVNHAASYSKSTGADLSRWLNTIMLTSDSDKESKDNCVNLMTLHACKGLEFPVVYMAGVETKIMPHARALNEAKDANAAAEALEEERRICYVGMTRAEERLIVSYCNRRPRRDKNGFLKEEKAGPSRFLKESGLIK